MFLRKDPQCKHQLWQKRRKKIGDTVLFFEIRRIEGHTTIRVQHALLATLAKAVRSGQVNSTQLSTLLRFGRTRLEKLECL